MKSEDHLTNEQKKINQNSKPKKKKQERVNWPEIMGMNRDIYSRHHGALRRK